MSRVAVVALVIAALNSAGVTASGRPGDPRAAEFCTVKRVGGRDMKVVLDTARVAVEVWAQSEARAEVLSGTVRDTIRALVASDGRVMASRESFVGSVPDPLTGSPRWRIDVDMTLTTN